MRKRILTLALLGMLAGDALAQRPTDALDRGLVAVQTDGGVFCSWRILGEEYYGVEYNIYRDHEKLNSEPLNVSNYLDPGGNASSRYYVEAVVRGVPQAHSPEVETWTNNYLEVEMDQAHSPEVETWTNNYLEVEMDHGDLKSTYIPNDACCADVDGDGELEIILKFDNSSDANAGYLPGGYNGEYAIIEVYKLDGQKLWWIDLGPNMTDFQNNENNIIAYDWDGDGKAEVVLRAADGTTIHDKDDVTTHVVGDPARTTAPKDPTVGRSSYTRARNICSTSTARPARSIRRWSTR